MSIWPLIIITLVIIEQSLFFTCMYVVIDDVLDDRTKKELRLKKNVLLNRARTRIKRLKGILRK